MKTIFKFILFSTLILLQTVVYAQNADLTLGGGTGELDIRYNKNGTYQIYRNNLNQFFSDANIFAVKVGAGIVVSSNSATIGNDVISNVGTRQERTKTFSGISSGGYPISINLKLIYDTSNPDYLIKEATLDLSSVPATTMTSYAYGWDAFVNGCDGGAAYILPDVNGYNLVDASHNLTTALVQSLRFVGAVNDRGVGAFMGFFQMGRPFDRAYSARYNGAYATTVITSTQNLFKFGPANVPSCSGGSDWDDGVGVVYDNIPGGQIVTIRTGLTFTQSLTGELDYYWRLNNVDSKNLLANINDLVSLKLNYQSYSMAQLNNIGFNVDFPGLKIRTNGGCNSTGFISAPSTCVLNNEFYQLSGASIAANGLGSIDVPIRIDRAGQWVVDGNSITSMTNTLPFGSPATLTVMTDVGLSSTTAVNYCGGSQTFTVKFKNSEIASQPVVVNLAYSGATADFSTRPATVTIPEGSNSATFTVISVASPAGTSPMTITLSSTDKVFATVNTASNAVSVRAYANLAGGTIAGTASVCSGSTPATLTSSSVATGGSGSYAYQWESSLNNSTWTAISGATSTAYSPGVLTQTTYYRRRATDAACGSVNSNTVTVTVNPLPVLTTVPDKVTEAGQTVAAITFAGSDVNAATTTWVGSTTAIGLAASGTGNIAAFTAINSTMGAIIDTVTVTPRSTAGCAGTASKFLITVYPKPELRRDSATVQEYKSIRIDVLNNDYLPPAMLNASFNLSSAVLTNPVAGKVQAAGSGSGSYFMYEHTGYNETTLLPATLTNSIDSFEYRISGTSAYSGAFMLTAKVYVYVLQSAKGSFAYCSATSNETTLKSLPAGVSFYWYDATGNTLLGGTNPSVSRTGTAPSSYYVEPRITSGFYAGFFPKGKLDIEAQGTASSPAKMKWTGLVNSDWNNPNNWVVVNSGFESPAFYAPALCTDVIISSTAVKFPELADSAFCNNIKIEDRAMIKNPHVLKYTGASVDIKMRPSEFNRFVMWSAPLKDEYSGDYHYYAGTNTNPHFGDVFMNYFQKMNPDYTTSAAAKNSFTATFGKTYETLPLGKPFNLKITETTVTRDSTLHFPARETVYDSQTLSRTSKNRFITDGVTLSSGTFNMPVDGNNAGFDIIQVVNPYLAYLKISDFIAGNTADLNSGYYIWNGEINTGFITYNVLNNGNRFITTSFTPPFGSLPDLIPPLQSFFVAKKTAATNITSLKMSPNWTTTSSSSSGAYLLRSTTLKSGGVLNIKLSQGKKEADAAMAYVPGASNFVESDDMPVLVFDEIPLTVYTYSITNVPLSINSSNSFDMMPIPLGLRVKDAGETKLDFYSLETFGYNVTLVDKLQNKEIDLQTSPSYTFTVAKQGSGTVEINDRFQLRMSFTGKGLIYTDNEEAKATTLQITGGVGCVYIKSNGAPVESVQIYDANGRLIYDAENMNTNEHRVDLSGQHVYMVRVKANAEIRTEKTYVR